MKGCHIYVSSDYLNDIVVLAEYIIIWVCFPQLRRKLLQSISYWHHDCHCIGLKNHSQLCKVVNLTKISPDRSLRRHRCSPPEGGSLAGTPPFRGWHTRQAAASPDPSFYQWSEVFRPRTTPRRHQSGTISCRPQWRNSPRWVDHFWNILQYVIT